MPRLEVGAPPLLAAHREGSLVRLHTHAHRLPFEALERRESRAVEHVSLFQHACEDSLLGELGTRTLLGHPGLEIPGQDYAGQALDDDTDLPCIENVRLGRVEVLSRTRR